MTAYQIVTPRMKQSGKAPRVSKDCKMRLSRIIIYIHDTELSDSVPGRARIHYPISHLWVEHCQDSQTDVVPVSKRTTQVSH